MTSGNTIDVAVDQMPPGSRVTLTYNATVGTGISPAEVLNNAATVRYTSLPGMQGTVANPTGSVLPGNSGTDTGERNGSGAGSNDYLATRSAPVTGRRPTLNKTRVETSLVSANNTESQVTIGELVTYELVVQIPEGQTSAARIVDSLDPGLALVDVLSVASSSALSISNPIGTGPTPANVLVSNGGRTVSFNPGDIVNTDTNDGVAETITIRYRAAVLNTAGNHATPTTDLANSAQFFWTGNSLTPVSSEATRVVEPDLQVQKSASPIQADALDTVGFTITIGHTAASTTDAYDITLDDVLPAGFAYEGASLTFVSGVPPIGLTESGGTISAAWTTLALGQTSTLQFQATVNALQQAGSSLSNTATIQWTSLPGPTDSDLSVHDPNSRERTGTGGANDYVDTDTATVSVDVASNKSIAATSEAGTTGGSVTIGEIVRYHLSVQLPEGTAPGFRIIDALPDGMQFLNDGTALFAFVSNQSGIQSSTLGSSVVQIGASGSLTPTFILPAAAVAGGPFAGGTDPIFSLGDLINSDNDADAEFVILEFNAIVLNVASNFAGVTHANRFRTLVAGSQVGPVSNTVSTRVVEPSITDVAKNVLTPAGGGVDANQTVTYAVSFSNSSGPQSATAYDVRLTETLPVELTNLANLRVLRNGLAVPGGFINNSTGSSLDVVLAQVAPGDQIEVRYDVTVALSTPPGIAIDNLVDLRYSSLPGDRGTTPNTTESTPGTPGSSSGERNGSGGVNNYVDGDNTSINTFSHEIAGSVYRDQNNNGVFDELAAAALAGVTVQLAGVDHLGTTVNRSTTTDGSGSYSFSGLRPGSYSVRELQPSGYLNGRDALGSPSFGAVNVSPYDDTLGTLIIPVGTASVQSVNHVFGELEPATISGFVYVDGNNDGLAVGNRGSRG